jgi:single-strand DNA-binding protein
MANYNKIILVGNLTRDPQMSYLPSQTPVVEFGMAVNRRWRGPDNQQREETCFIDCRAYGKQAETINQYLGKGRPVLVEGRLQYDTWEGKDGQKHSKHRVIVERFQFLGAVGQGQGQGQGQAQGQGAPRPAPSRPAAAPPQAPEGAEPPPPDFEEAGGSGEDIPF